MPETNRVGQQKGTAVATNQAFDFDSTSNTLPGSPRSRRRRYPNQEAYVVGNIRQHDYLDQPRGGGQRHLQMGDHRCRKWSPTRNFKFTDETGDTYSLSVVSPVVENHEVSYNSSEPSIVKTPWRACLPWQCLTSITRGRIRTFRGRPAIVDGAYHAKRRPRCSVLERLALRS
jgi:hypothetical protein